MGHTPEITNYMVKVHISVAFIWRVSNENSICRGFLMAMLVPFVEHLEFLVRLLEFMALLAFQILQIWVFGILGCTGGFGKPENSEFSAAGILWFNQTYRALHHLKPSIHFEMIVMLLVMISQHSRTSNLLMGCWWYFALQVICILWMLQPLARSGTL